MTQHARLNLRKLQHLAGRALQNGIALHFDSALLFRNRSYGTAHFISVLAMEEIGKAFAADHYAWSEKTNDRSDSDFEAQWIGWLLSDHRGKQLSFLRVLSPSKALAQYYDVLHKQLEARKQNSIYVGLSRPAANRPRTEGQLLFPRQVTRKQAYAQVSVVNDFLNEQLCGLDSGLLEHDLAVFNRLFTPALRKRLNNAL